MTAVTGKDIPSNVYKCFLVADLIQEKMFLLRLQKFFCDRLTTGKDVYCKAYNLFSVTGVIQEQMFLLKLTNIFQ